MISFLLVRRRRAAKKSTQRRGKPAGPHCGRARAPRPVACRMRCSFDLCRDWLLLVPLRFSQSQLMRSIFLSRRTKGSGSWTLSETARGNGRPTPKKKAQLAEYKEALKDTSTAQKAMTVATAHSCKNFWNTNFENEVIRLKNDDAYHLLRAPYESK